MGVYSSTYLKGFNYYQNWVFRENRALLHEYLDDVWERIEHDSIIKEFKEDPYLAFQVLMDFYNNKTNTEINWKETLEYIKNPGNDIILITGSKRAGKTYDGWRILDAVQDEYEPYWIGEPATLPEWCHTAVDLASVPRDGIGMMDEATIRMNNRRSMSSETVDTLDIIPVIAHTGRKAIFISQNTSRSDVAITSWADLHIQKQYSGIYSKETERNIIANKVDRYFDPILRNKQWSYAISSKFRMLYKGPELPWYNDTISKTFCGFNSEKDAMVYATRMAIDDHTAKNMEQIMRIKGYQKPVQFWEEFIIETRTNPGKAIAKVQGSSNILAAMA